jgi:ATP-dependent helicase/DNAse subunit B
LPQARALFAENLTGVGVFYVNLWGKQSGSRNRTETLENPEQNRKSSYRHSGRFDQDSLPLLDRRNLPSGDQFNFRLTKERKVFQNSREPMASGDFEALLNSVEQNLIAMGQKIFSGSIEIAPFRNGSAKACDLCDYHAICRIDPWTHSYRILD